MSTAVIGATGRVGSQIVRGVLARGDAVTALVRDPGKARRAFGEPGGLDIRPTRLSAELGEPSPSGSRPNGSTSSASPAPGYRRGPLNCSSRANGRSWPARTTTPPAPSARSPAAPAPRRRVPS